MLISWAEAHINNAHHSNVSIPQAANRASGSKSRFGFATSPDVRRFATISDIEKGEPLIGSGIDLGKIIKATEPFKARSPSILIINFDDHTST